MLLWVYMVCIGLHSTYATWLLSAGYCNVLVLVMVKIEILGGVKFQGDGLISSIYLTVLGRFQTGLLLVVGLKPFLNFYIE